MSDPIFDEDFKTVIERNYHINNFVVKEDRKLYFC